MFDFLVILEQILVIIILIPFLLGNLFFTIGSLIQKKIYALIEKKLNIEKKQTHSRILNVVNLVVWLIIGVVLLFTLDAPISIDGLFIFLAFRSGLTLSKRVVLGIHDVKVMRNQMSEKKYLKIASLAVKISVIIEVVFILAWALSYRFINVTVKSSLGIDINYLVIFLWVLGAVYGLVISLIISSFSKQFLLKGEIGIVLLFSGVALKDKFNEKVKGAKFLDKIKSSIDNLK